MPCSIFWIESRVRRLGKTLETKGEAAHDPLRGPQDEELGIEAGRRRGDRGQIGKIVGRAPPPTRLHVFDRTVDAFGDGGPERRAPSARIDAPAVADQVLAQALAGTARHLDAEERDEL